MSDSLILAGPPNKPAGVPTRDNLASGEFIIAVDFEAVTIINGAPITSYHVEIDDGEGGDFTEVKGGLANDLSLLAKRDSTITRGSLYRVRYRARNEVGFGDFSDPAYVLAASVPYDPERPAVKFEGN